MAEPADTIDRVNNSHKRGQEMSAEDLMQAAQVLDSAQDKSLPGFAAARKRVEGQLEEMGY
jgi:hypothetical protein